MPAYLVQQLSSLGLLPDIQRATVFNASEGDAAIVHNILVRVPGTAVVGREHTQEL